jgi:hypothetical protein
MSMEEKESSINAEMDKKSKQLKQFVIVKEYNGSHNIQKKTKREYTEKTMLKEKVSKSERNSLEGVFLDRKPISERDREKDNFLEKDFFHKSELLDQSKQDSIKYVTFVELLPIIEDNLNRENDRENDNSDSYYMSEESSAESEESSEKSLAESEESSEESSAESEESPVAIEVTSTKCEELLIESNLAPIVEAKSVKVGPRDNRYKDNSNTKSKEIISNTTIKKIKDGAFYSILTAGGLLGAYALFKGVSSFDNN